MSPVFFLGIVPCVQRGGVLESIKFEYTIVPIANSDGKVERGRCCTCKEERFFLLPSRFDVSMSTSTPALRLPLLAAAAPGQ